MILFEYEYVEIWHVPGDFPTAVLVGLYFTDTATMNSFWFWNECP